MRRLTLTLNCSNILDGELGAEQPGHAGLVEYVQAKGPLGSEKAAVRAAQVPEQRPRRRTRHFLRYKLRGQNTGGQAADAHLVENITFLESLLEVLAGSLLSRLEIDGH